MTTTSLLPHKPPPLKPRNNPTVFLRTNYYGSMGRPSSGKRRSAVELLEESKFLYVKSESVLDAKQRLKNSDQLHVTSPSVDMLRSPAPPVINGGGPFPFAMCLTCPPYPHQHFEHFDINPHAKHHLSAVCGAGNSSGPPSVESGDSTGSTGGGGVNIATLGRASKHLQHQHNHHHHHHKSHHSKSRSSSTGSRGNQHRENTGFTPMFLIDPNMSSKTNTIGRVKRSVVQPPGCLPMPKQLQISRLRKDTSNVLGALLPGMSFTLPAQSSFHKQSSHHHHHHRPHQHHPNPQEVLQQQQLALSSLSNSSSAALSLSSGASFVAANNSNSSITSAGLNMARFANGQRSSSGSGSGNGKSIGVTSTSLNKKHSLPSNSLLGTVSSASSQLTSSAQSHVSSVTNQNAANVNRMKFGNHGVTHHRDHTDDSPPPLPPKSPRITSKPARPHDFPQQLQLQVVDSSLESGDGPGGSNKGPPPPPRRHSYKDTTSQAKYFRLLQDQSNNKLPQSIIGDPTQSMTSMTLPSPILPPTPPPDVALESPMSDSGPIISPPPAFSTPVTPMIDRQNSTTSDKTGSAPMNPPPPPGRLRSLSQSTSHYHNITGFSLAPAPISSSIISGNIPTSSKDESKSHLHASQQKHSQQRQHNYHAPLSGTVSMSAISTTINNRRGSGSGRNNKSIPDLSSSVDISMRYSPTSRSRSNSSPMSPEESTPASSPEEDAEEDPSTSSMADNGHEGDDDCSEKLQSNISPKILAPRRNSLKLPPQSHSQIKGKVTLIPKSITENFLYKVSVNSGIIPGTIPKDSEIKTLSTATQAEANLKSRGRTTTEAPSPARRPILRSKSDLSHRYEKSFTLVNVHDLGLPPPLPMHNSISSNDFSSNVVTSSGGGTLRSHNTAAQHHIYETPNSTVNASTSTSSSHYHQPHNSHSTEIKRATKSTGDLERFFDMLGLDNTQTPAPAPLNEVKEGSRPGAGSESPVFFSSVSSIESAPRRSGSDSDDSPLEEKLGSRTVGGKFGGIAGSSILVQHGEPSIVERNARVIKWLFNCRKAMDRR